MNLQEYISSGILESYALGEISPAEQQEVEHNLTLYPELRDELAAIEKTMEALVVSVAVQPGESVRKAIMSKAGGATHTTKVISMSSTPVWRYAAAASIAVALLTSYMAYHYYAKWTETSFALNNLVAQNQQIAQDYNVVNEKLNKIQDDLSILQSGSFTKVILKGTANAPDALASVYWNSTSQEVYLSIQNLKELSQSNQFQLWAIVDGKPVDAGIFDTPSDGLLKMKPITGAGAFAITIEPRGGLMVPTLETMQAIGSLPKS